MVTLIYFFDDNEVRIFGKNMTLEWNSIGVEPCPIWPQISVYLKGVSWCACLFPSIFNWIQHKLLHIQEPSGALYEPGCRSCESNFVVFSDFFYIRQLKRDIFWIFIIAIAADEIATELAIYVTENQLISNCQICRIISNNHLDMISINLFWNASKVV